MKKLIAIVMLGVLSPIVLAAQTSSTLAGKYIDTKSQAVVEIDPADTGYTIQQISSPIEKDQQKNGKVFAAIENTAATPMKGYVIDSSTGKHYPSTFEVSDGGATVTMKLKVSMIHITTTWKKQ